MPIILELNQKLLKNFLASTQKNFSKFLEKILSCSAEHGNFGMDFLDRMREQLPETSCDNCGRCCSSVSIFSLEYHRIIRGLMLTSDVELISSCLKNIFRIDKRLTTIKKEKRIRCAFRDETTKSCLIHPYRPFACRFFGLKKNNAQQECKKVKQITMPDTSFDESFFFNLQAKVCENSESFTPYPQFEPIHFFPFEFWLIKYLYSTETALQFYREVLVPSSTPLTNLWTKDKMNYSNKPQTIL